MVHKKRCHFLAQFLMLFYMVNSFFTRAIFKNHWIEASDWLWKNTCQVLFSQHSQQNGSHHMEGNEILVQKMTTFHVYHSVNGHLSILKDVKWHKHVIKIVEALSKTCLTCQDDIKKRLVVTGLIVKSAIFSYCCNKQAKIKKPAKSKLNFVVSEPFKAESVDYCVGRPFQLSNGCSLRPIGHHRLTHRFQRRSLRR